MRYAIIAAVLLAGCAGITSPEQACTNAGYDAGTREHFSCTMQVRTLRASNQARSRCVAQGGGGWC